MRVHERWVSGELAEALARLTAQQSNGVIEIVKAELEERPVSSLLDCEGQICTSTTFYGSGRRKGWRQKPEFQAALTLARRDYRAYSLQHGTEEALEILATTAPAAARALRQQVVGDGVAIAALELALGAEDPGLRESAARRLGLTGLPEVVPALQRSLDREKTPAVREALVEALGHVASGAARDRGAAESVLDRADLRTATKGVQALTGGQGGPVEVGLFGALLDLDDEELAGLIENLEAADAGGDVG